MMVLVTCCIVAVVTVLLLAWIVVRGNLAELRELPPGPLIKNVTPIVGYMGYMSSAPHLDLCDLARKYGEAFTIRMGGYNIVVLNSARLIRECFGSVSYSGRPNHLLAMSTSSRGVTFATGAHAEEQRRFIVRTLKEFGFGKSSMEALVQEEVRKLVHHLSNYSGGVVQLDSVFGLSVINALWSVLASKRFHLGDTYARSVYTSVIEGFIDPPVSGCVWFLPEVAKLFPNWSGYNSVLRAVDNLKQLVDEVVLEHKARYDETHLVSDFVDAYLDRIRCETSETSSFYGDTGLTNLTHTLIDLFTAGSDTLNSTLNFAIRYLCEHPQIQSALHQEIDALLLERKHESVITVNYSDRVNLPLLDAVLTETLRLSSIVPNGIVHSTVNECRLDANGQCYNLKAGTIVMGNFYHIHHDDGVWDNPHNFDPYRWVGSNGLKKNLLAFSTGKRVCIAEHMAQVEMFCFLGGMLANFSVSAGCVGKVKSGLVLNLQGLVVRFTNRDTK